MLNVVSVASSVLRNQTFLDCYTVWYKLNFWHTQQETFISAWVGENGHMRCGGVARRVPWWNIHARNIHWTLRPQWNVHWTFTFLLHFIPVMFQHLFWTSRYFTSTPVFGWTYCHLWHHVHPLLHGLWHFVHRHISCLFLAAPFPYCDILSLCDFVSFCDILAFCFFIFLFHLMWHFVSV